jgi:predicted ATPase
VAKFRPQWLRAASLKRESVPSFEEYPFSLPVVHSLDYLELHPSVTFFVGENGSGKSTLLEAIAVAAGFNAEGGSRNFRFETRASHSPLHEQSHGEAFLALLMGRLSANGLYLLDEPEAALSPQRQLSALVRIHDLVQANCQFIIATHSPILLAYPDAIIYACTEDGIAPTAYEDTEHYQVTRDFLLNPKRMLDRLLADDEKD